MSYSITLTSAAEPINSSDTYQLILTFTVDLTASNESYSFGDKELVITQYGTTSLDFDFSELKVVPAIMNFAISDGNSYLHDLLYGTSAAALALDKKFEVEVKLNAATEFLGHSRENTITYEVEKQLTVGDPILGVLKFRAYPRTDIINKTVVFDSDGLPLDPLDYTVESAVAITALAIDYDGDEAKLQITHATKTYLVDDIVKIAGVSATERDISYINRSYTVTNVDSATLCRVLAPAMFEEDVDLTLSFGTVVKIDVDNTVFKASSAVIDDIYSLVDSGVVLGIYHDWVINMGWTQAVKVTNAVSAGGTTTITHAENTSISTQDADVAVSDKVVFEVFAGNSMTDLNGEFTVTAANSATEFEISLTTAQSFSVGAYVRKITSHTISNTAQIVDELFHTNTTLGINNLGDVLRAIATDWFAYTGMVHNEKAFFRKLTYYNGGALETLGTVLELEKGHSMGMYDFIQLTYAYSGSINKYYGFGSFTELDSQILQRTPFTAIIKSKAVTVDGDNNYPHDFSDSTVTHTSSIAQLAISCKDDSLSLGETPYYTWKPNLYLLAVLWHELLGEGSAYRVDKFKIDGVDYDYLKNFTHDGGKYNMLSISKNWDTNETAIEALYLGEV